MTESHVHKWGDPSLPAIIELDDGRLLTARRARTGDEAAILALYEGLSYESRYRRFFQPVPRITSAQSRFLTDFGRGVVWLAFFGDRCVADARIVDRADRPRAGDLAVTVADEFQHHEVGHHLSRLATADARSRGITHLVVSLLAINTAAARLARRNRIPLRFDSGMLEGDVELRPARRSA